MKSTAFLVFTLIAIPLIGAVKELSELEKNTFNYSLNPGETSGKNINLTPLLGLKLWTEPGEVEIHIKEWHIKENDDETNQVKLVLEVRKPKGRAISLLVTQAMSTEEISGKWIKRELEHERFTLEFEAPNRNNMFFFNGWISNGGPSPSGNRFTGVAIDFSPRFFVQGELDPKLIEPVGGADSTR